MEKEISYWIEHAQYDLGTAEAMLISGRYLYVTFMCQQAIEKLLKAIIIKF
ncbi:MAG: HEPN domain-containing protein [bacterium]|nr:MAG: HEPN domain-containing protein [bacterium]